MGLDYKKMIDERQIDHENIIDIRQNKYGTRAVLKTMYQGEETYMLWFENYEAELTCEQEQCIPLPWSEAKIKKFIELMDEKN